MLDVSCVILAGGRSQRFPYPRGKLFYPLAGVSILERVLKTAASINFQQLFLVVPEERLDEFQKVAAPYGFQCIPQREPLGTWNALQQAIPLLSSDKTFICNADMPLISKRLMNSVISRDRPFTLVSTLVHAPFGYGRIIRNVSGEFQGIIEQKELPVEWESIREVNAGLYCCETDYLKKVSVKKSDSEWYLTSLWSLDHSSILEKTHMIIAPDCREILGINTWQDFETVEQAFFQIQRERAVKEGAILENSQTIYLEDDVVIEAEVYLQGPVSVRGDSCLKKGAVIREYTILNNVVVEEDAQIGPFAKITENTTIKKSATAGSFVEIKRSILGSSTKAKHFAYIADTMCGVDCNFGAFVVTCNYDGKRKSQTIVDDRVFIGSGSQLVAPIHLQSDSYVGAGTTLTKSVASYQLVTRRAELRQTELKTRKRESCAE